MASKPIDPNTSELLTDFDIADVVNWDDQTFDSKGVDFTSASKVTAGHNVKEENFISSATKVLTTEVWSEETNTFLNHQVVISKQTSAFGKDNVLALQGLASRPGMDFDSHGLGGEEETSGLATLRELSSEVARQTPDTDADMGFLESSAVVTNSDNNVGQSGSTTASSSALDSVSSPKSTQFILVGGQKFPIGQGTIKTSQSTSPQSTPSSALSPSIPQVSLLSSQGPSLSGLASQSLKRDSPLSAPVSTIQSPQLPMQAHSQQQPVITSQQPTPTPAQSTNPVVLKVPANKLALKGQIVRTADQKLMLVTEVGGKKVGYLIRQQASQVPMQTGGLVLGNSSDGRTNTLASATESKTVSPQASVSSAVSSNCIQNTLGANALTSLPTSVTHAASLLTKAAEVVSRPPASIQCTPSDSSMSNTVTPGLETQSDKIVEQLSRVQGDDGLDKDSFDLGKIDPRTTDRSFELNTTQPDVNTRIYDVGCKVPEETKPEITESNPTALTSQTIEPHDSVLTLESNSPPAAQQMDVGMKSESSDEDSTPLSAVAASLKAQQESPEPLPAVSPSPKGKGRGTPKKEKAKKRVGRGKKKKNQIPKPVPAYQQFFKDIQASIRQENPTLTFGELSKVVSQTWEALDTEKKLVYQGRYDKARKEYGNKVAAQKLQEEQEDSAPLSSLIGKEPGAADPFSALSDPHADGDADISSTSSAHEESTEEPSISSTVVEDYADAEMAEEEHHESEDTPTLMDVDQLEADTIVLNLECNAPMSEEAEEFRDEGDTSLTASPVPEKVHSTRKQKKGSKIREPKEPKKRRKKKIREPVLIPELEPSEQPLEDTEMVPEAPVKITVKISEEGKVVKVDQPSPTKKPLSPVGGLGKFKIPIRNQKQDGVESLEGNKDENSESGERNDVKPRYVLGRRNITSLRLQRYLLKIAAGSTTSESIRSVSQNMVKRLAAFANCLCFTLSFDGQMHGPRLCVQDGCNNPAKTSRERGSQYCSNDCLVLHCKNVFNLWVDEIRSDAADS